MPERIQQKHFWVDVDIDPYGIGCEAQKCGIFVDEIKLQQR